jgi:acetyltransferase-like isoleucine patch superfamily enzyme
MQKNPTIKDVSVRDVICGERVTIVSPSNVYGCELGNEVFVGPFVEIQSGAIIGDRTRIQSHSFVCDLVTIGKDCFIGHGVMFINDLFATGGPARGDQSKWARTQIGDNVSIGSNATVLPVKIANGIVIGAGSVVTKNLDIRGVYAGNPAKMIRELG